MSRLGRVGGLALVVLALLAVPANARAGVLDPAFGNGGYALTPPNLNNIGQLATAPDGDIFVAGTYSAGQLGENSVDARLFRIASDGSSVSPLASIPHAWADDVAVQPDGKVVLAGTAYSSDPSYGDVPVGIGVWRYLSDGSPDTSFGEAGTVVIPQDTYDIYTGLGPRGLDLAADGRILVAGGTLVALLGPDGSVEQSYTGPDNWDIVAVDADDEGGAIIGGAWLTSPSGGIHGNETDDWLIRRLKPSLDPDPTFTPSVLGPGHNYPNEDGYASDLSVQSDGRVVVMAVRGDDHAPLVVRLTQTGALDPSFTFEQPPSPEVTFPDAVALDSQQRILLAGSGLLERLNPDGSPDSSFGPNGLTTQWPPENTISWVHNDVAVQPDGGIVVSFAGPDAELCCPDSPPAFSAAVARFVRSDAPASEVRCRGLKATIVGTNGPDHLKGTKRRDVIAGLEGNDRIRGLRGRDLICGGSGADVLRGGAGRDRLFGGLGRDLLDGGKGRDLLKGGKGRNQLRS